jgi:flagellar motor switch protein FliN/FliY
MTQGLPSGEPSVSENLSQATRWRQLSWLPCELSLELSVTRFTVRDLLTLRPGKIVETAHRWGAEIPLVANGKLIAWAEFEPVGNHIGVRITELT